VEACSRRFGYSATRPCPPRVVVSGSGRAIRRGHGGDTPFRGTRSALSECPRSGSVGPGGCGAQRTVPARCSRELEILVSDSRGITRAPRWLVRPELVTVPPCPCAARRYSPPKAVLSQCGVCRRDRWNVRFGSRHLSVASMTKHLKFSQASTPNGLYLSHRLAGVY
jgi:hypothetical protein